MITATLAIETLNRFDGRMSAAIDYLETSRAQHSYILHNTSHAPTRAECEAGIAQTTAALTDLHYANAALIRADGSHGRALAQLGKTRNSALAAPADAESYGVALRSGLAIDVLRACKPVKAAPADIGTRVMATIVAIALAAMAGCMTAGYARAETAPSMVIVAVDSKGGEWIAGEGDTCDAAWEFAQLPADMVAVECVPAN